MNKIVATSDNKDATYFALVHLHTLSLRSEFWSLGLTLTDNTNGHFITEVDCKGGKIKAETKNGKHTYTFFNCE